MPGLLAFDKYHAGGIFRLQRRRIRPLRRAPAKNPLQNEICNGLI
jgi:hypothetical protein